MQYIFPTTKYEHYRLPTHVNDLVMDRSQATASEVFVVVLEPGEAPPRHKHEDTEQIFYVLAGRGRLEAGTPPTNHPVSPGDVVRIPVGEFHRIFCEGNEPLRYLAIDCFPGGRPGAEPTWDEHVKVMCRQNGWSYDDVRAASNKHI
ncbi:MAG TPA: cupin domain-containing protein [Tepidisphaeraceae bacterium]|nr:cupin domain-containing protein [Tepidisphaeraceae bacterium]